MVISSRDNPRIKRLSKLISSRKARSEEKEFVIEGLRGCVDAVRSDLIEHRLKMTAIYSVPEAFDAVRNSIGPDIFNRIPEDKLFEITRDVAEKVGDAETSQGIFVTAKCVDKSFSADILKKDGRYLVLDELQDPGNLGTMLRTADAVGVDGVVLTGHCVDIYNPKTVRSAVGSLPRVDVFIDNDRKSVIEAFNDNGFKTAAAVVSEGEDILGFDFSGGCAVVIGNEGRGLSDECRALCSHKVSIRMKGNIDSLNAATAAAILLWEMTRGVQ